MGTSRKCLFVCAAMICTWWSSAPAKTSNGNDFALYYSEAKDPGAKTRLLEEAKGKAHFFRYLKIESMEEFDRNGRPAFNISATEPASLLQVKFVVDGPVSVSLLLENPTSKPGDAIAVTGNVLEADPEKSVITLEKAIVRHKDMLSPKPGEGRMKDVDPRANIYSYTGGPRPVKVEQRDEDLLQHRSKILLEQGPKAWVEFLEKEIANRRKREITDPFERSKKP